jgi:hypothetical protein
MNGGVMRGGPPVAPDVAPVSRRPEIASVPNLRIGCKQTRTSRFTRLSTCWITFRNSGWEPSILRRF